MQDPFFKAFRSIGSEQFSTKTDGEGAVHFNVFELPRSFFEVEGGVVFRSVSVAPLV